MVARIGEGVNYFTVNRRNWGLNGDCDGLNGARLAETRGKLLLPARSRRLGEIKEKSGPSRAKVRGASCEFWFASVCAISTVIIRRAVENDGRGFEAGR